MKQTRPEPTNAELLQLIVNQQREIDALKSKRRRLGRKRIPLTVMASTAMVIALTGAVYAAGPVTANVVHACVNTKTQAVSVTKSGKCAKSTTSFTWDQFTQIAATSPLAVTPGNKGSAPSLSLAGVVPVANGGTGSATQNFVGLSGNQTIGGNKTFSNTISGDISGNAGTVTNGLYSTGSYADPAWLTSLSGSKITGSVGNAQDFTGALSGDVTGTQSATTVGGIQGTAVSSTAPSTGQVLGFNGASWAPSGVHSLYNPVQVAELDWAPNQTITPVTVGKNPDGLAFDGSHMWVANSGANTVSEVDVPTQTVINTVTVGPGPEAVAFDGSHIWVANTGTNTVSEISVASHTVVNTVTVGSGPSAIAFDGTNLWVANGGGHTVSEISVASHSVINTVTVGSDPQGVAFDGNHIWVTNALNGNVSEISLATDTVINTVPVGSFPYGIAFDGSHVWVTNENSGTESVIDVASHSVINTVTVWSFPEGVAFDGSHMWVTNNGSDTVSEIDVASESVINTVNVGAGPQGVAFDGNHVWVANDTSGTVSVL